MGARHPAGQVGQVGQVLHFRGALPTRSRRRARAIARPAPCTKHCGMHKALPRRHWPCPTPTSSSACLQPARSRDRRTAGQRMCDCNVPLQPRLTSTHARECPLSCRTDVHFMQFNSVFTPQTREEGRRTTWTRMIAAIERDCSHGPLSPSAHAPTHQSAHAPNPIVEVRSMDGLACPRYANAGRMRDD